MSQPVDLEETSLITRINNNDKILRTLAKKLIEFKYNDSTDTKSSLKAEIQDLIFLYRFQLVRAQVQLQNSDSDHQFYLATLSDASGLIRRQGGDLGRRGQGPREEFGLGSRQNWQGQRPCKAFAESRQVRTRAAGSAEDRLGAAGDRGARADDSDEAGGAQ
jgi:hypothetical protein